MTSMSCLWLLMLPMLAGLPDGEWETLAGEKIVGQAVAVGAGEVRVKTEAGERTLPIGELLRFQAASEGKRKEATILKSVGHAVLVDGSRFGFDQVRHVDGELILEFKNSTLGTFQLPTARIASLRLQREESGLREAWQKLLEKSGQDDRLIIRKEDVLDFLGGVVGEISPERIKFLLDSEEHEVKADRVYGVIYAREIDPPREGVRVLLKGGESFVCRAVIQEDEKCRLDLPDDDSLVVPSEAVAELDYSFGKVQYLSDLEPVSVQYTPMFNVTWQYRRDRSLDGNPLRLNRRNYSRGLAIHSKTVLVYRLPVGYRRFRTLMGIDEEITRVGGDVIVLLEGLDEEGTPRELLNARVRLREPPRPIDLEIEGVRDLRITVDFGEGLDIGDHLDLVEARIIR